MATNKFADVLQVMQKPIEKKLGYIFGGFIRDNLAGADHFNDVDFFVSSFDETIQLLRHNGYIISYLSSNKCYFSEDYLQKNVIVHHLVNGDYQQFKLNLVKAKDPNKNPGPYGDAKNRSANLDADINSLHLDEAGNYHSCLGDNKVLSIIESIKAKRFKPQNGLLMNDPRIVKLLKKGFNIMSNTNGAEAGFVGMVKQDAVDAAYRITATQLSKAVKTAILTALKNQGTKHSQIKTIRNMLDTDVGEALISMMLGLGLTYAPVLKDNEKASTLAQEFRIGAMAGAGNAVIDTLTSTLLPVLFQAVSSLPQEEEKVRIAPPKVEEKLSDAVIEQAAEEELVVVQEAAKTL